MIDLTPFGDNIWTVDGPDVRDMGLLFTTRMTVIRLSDGSVWVESPVTLSTETVKKIREIGNVRFIVSSTQRHVWRLSSWHELFPEAELWAPPTSARFTVGKVSGPVRDVFTDTPPRGWATDIEQLAFKGSTVLRETVFFHKQSGTVIVGDLIQSNPMLTGRPIRNAVFKLMGAAAPKGGVGLDLRLSFRDRPGARRSLERLMSWDFHRLIIAHGPCVEANARQYIHDAFRWLLR